MPIEPGTCLGPYDILVKVGAGEMGEVYRARHARLERDRLEEINRAAVRIAREVAGDLLGAGETRGAAKGR